MESQRARQGMKCFAELTQLLHGTAKVVVGLLALPSQVQVRVEEGDALEHKQIYTLIHAHVHT